MPEGNGKLNGIYNHQNEDNLFFIFLNSRHGARTPLFLLDDHEDMLGGKWVGKGLLTKLGRRQHYKLGLKSRKRYPNFLNNEYDPREILIYSTNFSRSILSAESLLSGLYNNISYQKFNFTDIYNNDDDNMNLIIPPINLFIYNKEDKYKKKYEKIFHHRYHCPYLKDLVHKNGDRLGAIKTLVNNFNKEYYDILIKEYKNINKKEIKKIRGFDKFCDVYTSIYFSKSRIHILDKISKYGKNITKIKDVCLDYLYMVFIYGKYGGYANKNAIVVISPIIKRILNWMELRMEKSNNFESEYSKPKFVLYSGHDSTLFEMQFFLNEIFDIGLQYNDFASTQLFEVRKYNNLFYVEIYYNDKLKLNITYDEFKHEVEKNIIDDKFIYNLCYRTKNEIYIFNLKILLFSFNIILILIFCFLIWKINKLKKVSSNSQKTIQLE